MDNLIDHIVIDVRDRMAEGAAAWRRLGFQLTPMGKHSLGSANHLAIFGRDYLELLGTDIPGGALRPDIAPFPIGLNGLVFRAGDAEAVAAAQQARGVPVQPAQAFHRPADLPDGSRQDARFKTARLDRSAAFDGRLYWCEHLTPEHVWRPEWQSHPNGALGVARILLSVRDPERQAALFRRMFGAAAVTEGSDGRAILLAGEAVIEAVPHAAIASDIGSAAPDPAGRGDHMVLLGLRTRSLDETASALRINGVPFTPGTGLLRVPASEATNTTVDFMA